MKNKFVAAALAFFLGTFGVHKFYLRDPGAGIFYIMLFMMTQEFFAVSAILGWIDGMRYITMGQEEFDRKFNGRRKSKRNLPPPLQKRKKTSTRNREYYEYPSNKKDRSNNKPRSKNDRILRSNPFKKSGLKKYRDYDIEEAILDFEKALKIQPNDESIHFHLACANSLLENKDKAFYHVAMAVANGFNDVKKIQEHDDLAYMRIQPEYDEFKENGYKLNVRKQLEDKEENDDLLLEKLGKLVEMRKRGIVTEKDFRVEREKLLRKA